MPVRPPAVKPALQLTNQIGPRAYARWRASRLGSVTEALEQTRILNLIGPVEGRRILDLGCGDGLLTRTLAERGAWAVGIDVDRAMLDVASARSVRSQRQRPRFVEGRIEQLPFLARQELRCRRDRDGAVPGGRPGRRGARGRARPAARGTTRDRRLGPLERMGRTAPRQGVAGIKTVAVRALLDGPRSIPTSQAFGLNRRSGAWVCVLPADRCTGPPSGAV